MTTRKNPEHKGRVARASLKTAADPMQLWEAWADPAKLGHWFPDRAEGRAVAGAVQTWFFDRFNYAMPYEVYSSVPGEHLVYTGQMPGRPRFYLEIAITREAGTTVLTLTNSGFLDKEGWDDEYRGDRVGVADGAGDLEAIRRALLWPPARAVLRDATRAVPVRRPVAALP